MDHFDLALLLDYLKLELNLANDLELAQALEVHAKLLSAIRQRKQELGAALLIRINDATGVSIGELRLAMGDRRRRARISSVEGRRYPAPRIRTTWDRLALQRKK